MIKNILTVCVGNICRSPMAEALLKQAVPSANVSSAGIGALVGHSADATAIELMKAREIDLTEHRAQQINMDMCKRADIILVMEDGHRSYFQERYPFTRGKVFRLAEHASLDIPDPYKKPREDFEYALTLISEGVRVWSERISRL